MSDSSFLPVLIRPLHPSNVIRTIRRVLREQSQQVAFYSPIQHWDHRSHHLAHYRLPSHRDSPVGLENGTSPRPARSTRPAHHSKPSSPPQVCAPSGSWLSMPPPCRGEESRPVPVRPTQIMHSCGRSSACPRPANLLARLRFGRADERASDGARLYATVVAHLGTPIVAACGAHHVIAAHGADVLAVP